MGTLISHTSLNIQIHNYTHTFHFSKSKSRKRGLYISENSKCLLKMSAKKILKF